jgi:hypothetical protein
VACRQAIRFSFAREPYSSD